MMLVAGSLIEVAGRGPPASGEAFSGTTVQRATEPGRWVPKYWLTLPVARVRGPPLVPVPVTGFPEKSPGLRQVSFRDRFRSV
ncbi:hypothetical protein [Kitasatospora sp. NPDC098663]|uniref:hypothetical protein n=1 Tax=Kitasatospora sp. NPDC098663 TaxID=3364096 RepID=UPI00381DD622